MQRAFLISNKATQVKDYLERRSIIEIVEEHRTLTELDLSKLGIIDVHKFVYIYYASEDGDISFRADLNVLRQLLNSAFFHTDEGLFILIDCKNPMLEDLINSACRDTHIVGPNLTVIHHTGALTFNDVTRYVAGTTIGEQTTSSYKNVYIREADIDERERYDSQISDGISSILPMLTDQYTMYQKRAQVEAFSSSRIVTDPLSRAQVMKDFAKVKMPASRQLQAFLVSGEDFTNFENAAIYLTNYFVHVGLRSLVVDLTSNRSDIMTTEAIVLQLKDLLKKTAFTEKVGYLRCRFNQLGYIVSMLDNIEGVERYVFLCNREHLCVMKSLLEPICSTLYTNFVSHYTEESVVKYLNMGAAVTTVFLSSVTKHEIFQLMHYKDNFSGTRVAEFPKDSAGVIDFYECAIGGVVYE